MDMLFEEINHEKKIRLHFHRFMQNLHESLKQHEGTDPLKKIVKDLSKKYECLCFDEFYVEDIADAMLLGKFMTELFESDLSFFATSNIAPINLYEGGFAEKVIPASYKSY